MFLPHQISHLKPSPSIRIWGFHAFVKAVTLTLCIAFTPLQTVTAQGSDEQRRAAIASAMSQAGGQGKVLSVKPQEISSGKPGFRVRILTNGRVRLFDVPAEGSN